MTLLEHPADRTAGTDSHIRRARARAAFLRDVAVAVEPILATSIRRRASELELEAWVLELRDTV